MMVVVVMAVVAFTPYFFPPFSDLLEFCDFGRFELFVSDALCLVGCFWFTRPPLLFSVLYAPHQNTSNIRDRKKKDKNHIHIVSYT